MPLAPATRRLTLALTIAVVGAAAVTRLAGAVPGQSFTYLASGFTQELVGVTEDIRDTEFGILGGVAFATDANPIVAECEFAGTRIHRFNLQNTSPVHGSDLAAETILPSQGGCGLVNHPDGSVYVAMNDGLNGIANINRNTGALIGFMGPPANSLGIAVDPTNGHLVYAAEDCRFTTQCTFIDLDPTDGSSSVFAVLPGEDADFVDGMYFNPTGSHLFLSNRSPEFRLTILDRAGCLGLSSDPCLAQHVPMLSEPDGVAFKAASPKFVVTNNIDGTMTRFDFPGDDYSAPPTQSVFASGGFRGDLTQVGADGCIYLTQDGVRYDDLTESAPEDPDNSVVRICGGFAPPPGVETLDDAAVIGDFVWEDLDHNGVQDPGEPGIEGVTVSLSDGSSTITTTTDGNGFYEFGPLAAGTYTVSAATPAGYVPTLANAGANDAVDSDGASTTSTLAADGQDLTLDFGFVRTASIGDFVWHDLNGNGLQESSEPGISGVTVTLTGATVSGSTMTDINGLYNFENLPSGSYTVAVSTPAGYAPTIANAGSDIIDSDGPSTVVSLQGGLDDMSNDFGFVTAVPLGAISGFAYWDQNADGVKNGSEPGIGNVLITLAGPETGNTPTALDGSYSFVELPAGTYQVSAPASADGKTLTTPSPLTVVLDPGEIQPDVNFGYRVIAFRTQTQGGWGAPPNGNNPGALLAANFGAVFPSGITIGSTFTLKFTSASAVEKFLPAGGKASPLTSSAVNPTKSNAGVFAGQVLALTISVAMSNAGVITAGLDDLYIAPGQQMAGYTVAQVLAFANAALGGNLSGLPAGVTVSKLNDVVSSINENYVDGNQDHGFLVP